MRSATKEQQGGEEFPAPAVESEEENARMNDVVSRFHLDSHIGDGSFIIMPSLCRVNITVFDFGDFLGGI